MNKTIILSLLLLAGSANMAFAGKKDKNKNKKVAATEQVKLATASDSLSYMAGKTATKGLLPYLINRMNVDTVFMADFVKGYRMLSARPTTHSLLHTLLALLSLVR